MTNPFNSAVSVIEQGSSERAAKALSHQTAVAKPRWQAFGLTLCLSIVSAFAVGVTSYYITNPSTVEQVAQTRHDETSGSPILQKHLLLTLTLATSITALLASAIALVVLRQSSSIPPSEKTLLLGEIASQAQRVELDYLYQQAVNGARKILNADRAIVYIFDANCHGTITAESVASGVTPSLGHQIVDTCMKETKGELYRNGRVYVVNNIAQADLSECHLNLLENYQVKANMVVPILKDDRLLGLLIAHQCDRPRVWQQDEIDFFVQLAVQIGFALEQANLVEQVQAVSQQQQQQTEEIQRQLFNLLQDVERAAQGNLTVRAEVTEGEIGTVADFFNALVERLRKIVTQVKRATNQVNTSLSNNEQAIVQLSSNALKQAQETTRTLESLEQMARSIQQVAERAHHAATVARNASETAQVGTQVMERTVEKISTLRDTVAHAANKVRRLGESSQQISKVVALINQIALQTNLLAINAGIEAARAGEESQSFAAVANEVSELAARSAHATQEIEYIVETIQAETTQLVETMELGTLQVSQGTQLVEETQQSLSQILDVSRQIDQLVASISTASVSQVETSFAVTELMKDIAKVSEETSESSHQISHSLQETVDIAQELQESVDMFNVDETEPPTRSDLD